MEFDIEKALAKLRQDFLGNISESLDQMDDLIACMYNDQGDRGAHFSQFQREVHSLKGIAGTYGFPSVTLIAHRLEDYIEASLRLGKDQWLDVQKYIDTIRTILASGEDPSETEKDEILGRLPAYLSNGEGRENARDITILLVMPSGLQRKLVGAELAAFGYDLSLADDAIGAIRLALHLKPNVIFATVELVDISGIELAKVFRTLKATAETPFAVITSYERTAPALAGLPSEARILRKGDHFKAELDACLFDLGISLPN